MKSEGGAAVVPARGPTDGGRSRGVIRLTGNAFASPALWAHVEERHESGFIPFREA